MAWQEETYKFKVLEIKKPGFIQGFDKTYKLRAYGKNNEVLDYPFGNFSSLKVIRDRACELMKQIPHPCKLEKGVEVITETIYTIGMGLSSQRFTKRRELTKNFR